MKLSYMVIKGSNSFILPSKPDVMMTLEEDILMEVTVQPVNSRGHLGLSKNDYEKVISLMVVVYISCYLYLLRHPVKMIVSGDKPKKFLCLKLKG